jgi:hypothetical protein
MDRSELRERVLGHWNSREVFDYREFLQNEAPKYGRLIAGNLTLSDPKTRHKWIDWRHESDVTVPEVAKQYIRYIWAEQKDPSRKRVGFSKRMMPLLQEPVPQYRAPLQQGDFAYVDIRRAHWDIIRAHGLDVYFVPQDRALLWGQVAFIDSEWLAGEKGAYTALLGHTKSHELSVYKKGVPVRPRPQAFNQFLAPSLHALINWTLAHVAHEVQQRFGVLYWNNDGMILPYDNADSVITYIAEEWNLEARIQEAMPESRRPGNRRERNRELHIPYDELLATKLKRWRKEALTRAGEHVY